MQTPAGFTALTAANIQDASGLLLTSGFLVVLPTDASDEPIPAAAGGAGGWIGRTTFPVCNGQLGPSGLLTGQNWAGTYVPGSTANVGDVVGFTPSGGTLGYYLNGTVANTALPTGAGWTLLPNARGPWLADTALTKPHDISYRLVVQDFEGAQIGPSIKGVQFAPAPTPTATWNLDTAALPGSPQAPYVQGPAGQSAYQVWLGDGHTGTVAQYLASLQGASGSTTPNFTQPITAPVVAVGDQQQIGDTTSVTSALGALMPDAVDVIADENGAAVRVITRQGDYIIYGNLQVTRGLTFVGLGVSALAIGATGVTGDMVQATGTETLVDALADQNGYVAYGLMGDGSRVTYGNELAYGQRIPKSAAVPDPDRVAYMNLSPAAGGAVDVVLRQLASRLLILYGQSLATGYTPDTPVALSTAQPLDSLMFAGGVRYPSNGSGGGPAGTELASTVPLVEATVTNEGETMASGYCFFLRTELMRRGYGVIMGAVSTAANGQSYSSIAQGTQPFTNTVAAATAWRSLLGAGAGVDAVVMAHGEADESLSNTNYSANLVTLQANLQTNLQQATGQTGTIPMFMWQTSSGSIYNKTDPIIPPQQQSVARANPTLIKLIGPEYFLPHTSDGLHMTPQSERLMGEYAAKARMADLLTLGGWRPLEPNSVWRTGLQVTVYMHVPVMPMQFDTVSVTEPTAWPGGLHGFEFADHSGASIAITAAVISGRAVTLTLASQPSTNSNTLSYARHCTSGVAAGPTTGARGCLRDSDITPSAYTGQPLYNWCPTFILPCN